MITIALIQLLGFSIASEEEITNERAQGNLLNYMVVAFQTNLTILFSTVAVFNLLPFWIISSFAILVGSFSNHLLALKSFQKWYFTELEDQPSYKLELRMLKDGSQEAGVFATEDIAV